MNRITDAVTSFPLTIIDDFYPDINKVFAYANSLKFVEDENHYPGKRTQSLHTVNEELFDIFCSRLFSVFYETSVDWCVDTCFHLIDKDSFSKVIHRDDNCLIAGVVYLEDTGGTDIYDWVENPSEDDHNRLQKYMLDSKIVDNTKDLSQYNDIFTKSVSVKSKKNRCVLYDARQWHAPVFTAEKYRLTQPFFVEWINATSLPLTRN